jgi:hypothetical protein
LAVPLPMPVSRQIVLQEYTWARLGLRGAHEGYVEVWTPDVPTDSGGDAAAPSDFVK